jgi:HTH-type transcriptional regulator, sugar sensing transcriptional regulator
MKEILKNIGFDENETEIYVALLKHGTSTVNTLLKHTQIERRTIYDVLARLIQKGKVSFYEENNTKTYSAISPEIILEDLQQKQNEFKKIIPSLAQIQFNPKEATVEVLKGTKGLRTIFLDIINKEVEHYVFGDISPLIYEDRYSIPTKQFLASLKEKKLTEKVIYREKDKITKIPGSEYRFVKKELVFPTPTLLYADVVTQYIFTDPITIIKITSKEMSQTHKKYFDYFWKVAKK